MKRDPLSKRGLWGRKSGKYFFDVQRNENERRGEGPRGCFEGGNGAPDWKQGVTGDFQGREKKTLKIGEKTKWVPRRNHDVLESEDFATARREFPMRKGLPKGKPKEREKNIRSEGGLQWGTNKKTRIVIIGGRLTNPTASKKDLEKPRKAWRPEQRVPE